LLRVLSRYGTLKPLHFDDDAAPNPSFPVHSGRSEFVDYLPDATQGVVVQPVGSRGVLVAATDTVRGFSRLDQVRDPGRRSVRAGTVE